MRSNKGDGNPTYRANVYGTKVICSIDIGEPWPLEETLEELAYDDLPECYKQINLINSIT